MDDQLTETWAIHNRINLLLVDAIPETALAAKLEKTRSVHDLFAHIHNVRLMWLKPSAPELLEGLEKLPAKGRATKKQIRVALGQSGKALESVFRAAGGNGGKMKGFKPHAAAFLGYLISHESHHRGQIGWTLKLTGQPLEQKIAYGIWDWSRR
jgi:uncharacterized damage-inducible protein DinB